MAKREPPVPRRKVRGSKKQISRAKVAKVVGHFLSKNVRPRWFRTARVDFFRLASMPGFDNATLRGWAGGWLEALAEKKDKELFLRGLRVWVSAAAALKQIEAERAHGCRATELRKVSRRK